MVQETSDDELNLEGIASMAIDPADIEKLTEKELALLKNRIHTINAELDRGYDPSNDEYQIDMKLPRRAIAGFIVKVYKDKGWLGLSSHVLPTPDNKDYRYRFTFRKQPVEKQGQ